ncbi:MAG: hypothetical protein NZZ41_02850 [Candidatus Dojkabacteria bacterium]|nr:hypothetical protein [Candidatus Dojkabacteria bacterium]
MDTVAVRLHELTHVWFTLASKKQPDILNTRYDIADKFLTATTKDEYTQKVFNRLRDYPEYFDITVKDGTVMSATIKS